MADPYRPVPVPDPVVSKARIEAARVARKRLSPAMRGAMRWFTGEDGVRGPHQHTVDALQRREIVADFSRLTPLGHDVAAIMGLEEWRSE